MTTGTITLLERWANLSEAILFGANLSRSIGVPVYVPE
jgi:hypothetical protein